MDEVLSQPLDLPCGVTLPNRIAKAAMTEGLSDRHLRPTSKLCRLYERWSQGGAGLLITGNVQIDKRVLERPGNVAIDGNGGLRMLELWAQAGTTAGNHLWMQISHAGRQAPWYATREPLAPSEVQLKIMGNYRKPRAITEAEIRHLIGRWAAVAGVAKDAGFTGVQIHSAHGYLLSSFLSPAINKRDDIWGGALENRARMLLETIRAVRRRVGPRFPVAIKLNSADFQRGGFAFDDCLRLVEMLNEEGLDLLEISGGSYEQPQLFGMQGAQETAVTNSSTAKREAYFLEYAEQVRAIARMPVMVTGGFRSRAVMAAAIQTGATDVIGLGRPMCSDPDIAGKLIRAEVDEADRFERTLKTVGPKALWPLQLLGQQAWFGAQIQRMARGLAPRHSLKPLSCFMHAQVDEFTRAALLARRSPTLVREEPNYAGN